MVRSGEGGWLSGFRPQGLEDVSSAISYEVKILGEGDGDKRVIVGTEGDGIGVEGECLEGVGHRGRRIELRR